MENWSLFKTVKTDIPGIESSNGGFIADLLFRTPFDAYEFMRQLSYTYQALGILTTETTGTGDVYKMNVSTKKRIVELELVKQ